MPAVIWALVYARPGRALFLTGPSGVGKTAVALRLQEEFDDPWIFYEVDRCQPRTSTKEPPGFDLQDAERRMSRALLAAAHAYVSAGFDAIIEIDLADDYRQRCLVEIFAGTPVMRVVLTCTPHAHEQRLRARGGPVPDKWARMHLMSRDWRSVPADFVVVTDGQTVQETTAEVLDRLRSRSWPEHLG